MAHFIPTVFVWSLTLVFMVSCGGDSSESPSTELTPGGDDVSENEESTEGETGEESSAENNDSSGDEGTEATEESGGEGSEGEGSEASEGPAEEGGELPGEEGGEGPAEEGGEATEEEGGEIPTEEGGEGTEEEGGEATEEEGGEGPAEEGGELPGEEGGESTEEEGGEEGGVFPGCPSVDLTGSYELQFKISLDEKPWTVTMNIGAVDGPDCYGGTFISPITGDLIGSVASVVTKDADLELTVLNFMIPPGENPILPDGAEGDLVLTATKWGASPTLCGDIVYQMVKPIETQDIGTFAAVIQSSEYYLPEDAGYSCDLILKEETGEESSEEGGAEGETGGEEGEEGEEGGDTNPGGEEEGVCGDGLCDAGEPGSCDQDCSGPGVTYTIKTTSDFTAPNFKKYHPPNLSIAVGDTVRFMMTNQHNVVEVSQETFQNVGVTNLEGGFTVGYGKSKDIQFDSAGTHFFICYAYIYEGMVGTITVGGPSTQPGFSCDNGEIMPQGYVCDGYEDCYGGEDEVGCGTEE